MDENAEKETDQLLKQYKLYVKMADNVSSRRAQANAFYITVISALLAINSLLLENVSDSAQNVALLAVGLLGILLCVIWYVNIQSYRQLNTGKFQVIHEMEESLPFPCFDREWEILGHGEQRKLYFQLTRVEQFVPFVLMIPYLLLLIYGLWNVVR